MMNDSLVCNNYVLDLSENTAFPFKFSIADAREPNKRKRTTGITVALPGTQNNKQFFMDTFGYHSSGNQMNFDPTIRTNARYYKKGVEIIKDGVLQLQSVKIDKGVTTFNVQIFSESVDIFLLLQNINVGDLDWSAYNHTLSRTAIKDSWTTPDGTGYRYPLIQYRELVGNYIWRTTDLAPYVHVYEIIQKIFEYVGLRYESNFIDSPMFKKLLFGFGGGDYILKTMTVQEQLQRMVSIDNIEFNTDPFMARVNDVYYIQPLLLTGLNTTYNVVSDVLDQFNNAQTTIELDGNYRIAITGEITAELDAPDVQIISPNQFIFSILKNGQVIHSAPPPTTFTPSECVLTLNIDQTFQFAIGDVITFTIKAPSIEGGYENTLNSYKLITTEPIEYLLESKDTQVTDGSDIYLSRFIPEIKCSDFLLGIFRQFNLMMDEPNSSTGLVKIEPFTDFYTPTINSFDFTQLVDHSKPFELEPTANTLPKNILFRFKEADDYDFVTYKERWDKNYGDYTLVNPSHFVKGDMTIQLPWSTICPFDIGNGLIIPRFVKYESGVVKPNRGSARLVFWNGLKSGNWMLRNALDNLGESLTQYPSIHHFDDYQAPSFDLNFSIVKELYYTTTSITTVNSYNAYHRAFYNDMLSPNGQFVRCYVKFDDNNISNRRFRNTIMINGSVFRINEAGPYDTNVQGTTLFELVRVLSPSGTFGVTVNTNTISGSGTIVIKSPPNSNGLGTGVIVDPPFAVGENVKKLKSSKYE